MIFKELIIVLSLVSSGGSNQCLNEKHLNIYVAFHDVIKLSLQSYTYKPLLSALSLTRRLDFPRVEATTHGSGECMRFIKHLQIPP